MRSKSRLFVLVITLSLACTRDPRIRAVDELLEFVTGAPYTVEVTNWQDWEFLVPVVRVDALDRFNRIYAYFASDSVSPEEQRDHYRDLQYTFVQYLPVIAVDEVNYDLLGDTIKVSAIVKRPDRISYNTRLVEWTNSQDDRDDATSLDQTSLALEFQNRLSRAMAEPPTVDTIWVSVVDGPRITSLRTSTMVEDSLETAARIDSIRTHVRAVVDSAYFSAFDVSVGSSMVSIEGTVHRPPIGWMPRNIRRDDEVYIRYQVQCRGVGVGETPFDTGHVSTDGVLPWDDFICLWYDDSVMTAIRRVRVRRWEVRLAGFVFSDSIFGEWTRAR